MPKHAHGTINLDFRTSSSKIITSKTDELFERIINKNLSVRRINISVNNLKNEEEDKKENDFQQLNLFTNSEETVEKQKKEKKENNLQHTIIKIKNKYGKNAILKGMNFVDGGTTIERNGQVGGHNE